jgi:hypothetical protein
MWRYPGQLAAQSLRLEMLQVHWPLAQTGQVSDKGETKVHPVTCRDVTDGGRDVALLFF